MQLHCLYVYNSTNECLHYLEWNRPRQPVNASDDRQVVLGLAISADSVINKLSQQHDRAHMLRMDAYSMHVLRVPTGLRLVLLAERDAPEKEIQAHLWHMYASLYVPIVVLSAQPRSDAAHAAFEHALDSYSRTVVASEPTHRGATVK